MGWLADERMINKPFSQFYCFFESMPLECHGTRWRAWKKKGGAFVSGPWRTSKEVAEEEQRRFDAAAAVSLEALEDVRCSLATSDNTPLVALEKRSNGWRVRYGRGKRRRYGPTRKDKNTAEADVGRVVAASRESEDTVGRVLQELGTEGSAPSDDFAVQHLKVCLGRLDVMSLSRRQRDKYRAQERSAENAGIVRACQLLGSEHQLAENLAARADARWLFLLRTLGPVRLRRPTL